LSYLLETPLAMQSGARFIDDRPVYPNPANARHPSRDVADEASRLASLVGALISAAGTAADPPGDSEVVASHLLPGVLPCVVGNPATCGFAARNGRPLADNAPEAMLSLVTGTAVQSGLAQAVARHRALTGSRTTSQPAYGRLMFAVSCVRITDEH